MFSFYTPKEHRKTKGFFGVFRGYKMETLVWNGLTWLLNDLLLARAICIKQIDLIFAVYYQFLNLAMCQQCLVQPFFIKDRMVRCRWNCSRQKKFKIWCKSITLASIYFRSSSPVEWKAILKVYLEVLEVIKSFFYMIVAKASSDIQKNIAEI